MMGVHVEQKNLFSYGVNLEKLIRSDNPLRRIAEVVDFSFVRDEVRELYGHNGHESVDPEIILKLMFLLFSGFWLQEGAIAGFCLFVHDRDKPEDRLLSKGITLSTEDGEHPKAKRNCGP